MKSITRLKYFLTASICMANLIRTCSSDPYVSSKANVTQVKLIRVNTGDTPVSNKEELSFHSVPGKISKIIPVKRYSNANILGKNVTKLGQSGKPYNNSSIVKIIRPLSKRQRVTSSSIDAKRTVKKSKPNWMFSHSLPSSTSTSAPYFSKTLDKDELKKPLFLSSKSWEYINSIARNSELQQIMSDFSFDVIKNATILTSKNPKAAEEYLLQLIISELGKLKKSRMLDLEEDVANKINTGVRYSAKRKPVLNVIPLYNGGVRWETPETQKSEEHSRNDFESNSIDYRNVSGHVSNSAEKSAEDDIPLVNWDNSGGATIESNLKESASSPHSTASSLMHVLVAPEYEELRLQTTTYSPPFWSHSDFNGFVPVLPPMFDPLTHPETVSIPMFPSSIESTTAPIEHDPHIPDTLPNLTGRKARGPPTEEEYQLPSLTTSSTIKPEVSSYQTITESTTPGPKIVWYFHDQKPEDTFYPNSDNFLVPPEETSVETVKDLHLMKPVHDIETAVKNPAAFTAPYSPSPLTDTASKGNGISLYSDSGKATFSNENQNGGRAHRDSFKPTVTQLPEMNDKMTNKKAMPLQPQETTIVDHYPDEGYFVVNDGNRKPVRHRHQESRKQHFDTPPASYETDFKHHETSSRHREKNGGEDTASYIALNEVSHYHDSYPNKHEIGPTYFKQIDRDHYRDRDEPRPYRVENGGGGGRYRDGPDGDSDYYSRRPYSDRDRDRHRENSPGWGSDRYHGLSQYGHGHGWKDPHRDFFSKAKDYFKNSDFSTAEKWFDVSIGVLAFLAFGGYIIMLIYQVFTISSATPVGTLIGKSLRGAGEVFDIFFSKGPIGQAYMDELETIVKRAMANVKRIWLTKSFADTGWQAKQVKGEIDEK